MNDCSLLLGLRGAFVISIARFGLLQFLKKKKRGQDSGSLCLSKAALFPRAGMAHDNVLPLMRECFTALTHGLPVPALMQESRREMLGAPRDMRALYKAANGEHLG